MLSMCSNVFFAVVIAAGVVVGAGDVLAQVIPLQNAGFDAYQNDTSTLIPSSRYLSNPVAQAGTQDKQLHNAQTGGQSAGELADVPPGFDSFGDGGIFRHDVEFAAPTGSMGFISSDGQPGGFIQTLAGTPVQPNTTYTLTVDVSDRDTSSFTNGDIVAIGPDINLALFAGSTSNDLGGTKTFSPPPNGGTSTFTLVTTTGSTVPGGDLILAFSASGSSVGGNIVATQTFFDNVTLTATPVPEPTALSLLGVAALAALRRRRGA